MYTEISHFLLLYGTFIANLCFFCIIFKSLFVYEDVKVRLPYNTPHLPVRRTMFLNFVGKKRLAKDNGLFDSRIRKFVTFFVYGNQVFFKLKDYSLRHRNTKKNFAKGLDLLQTLIFSLIFFILTCCFFGTVTNYICSDFSIYNILTNSTADVPLFYKISATWSNHEGSLLLWCWLLSFNTFLYYINICPENSIKLSYLKNLFFECNTYKNSIFKICEASKVLNQFFNNISQKNTGIFRELSIRDARQVKSFPPTSASSHQLHLSLPILGELASIGLPSRLLTRYGVDKCLKRSVKREMTISLSIDRAKKNTQVSATNEKIYVRMIGFAPQIGNFVEKRGCVGRTQWTAFFRSTNVLDFCQQQKQNLKAITSLTAGFILLFFTTFCVITSNPFLRTSIPSINSLAELNPILQDPILAIHPPCIYLGYVASAIAFSLCMFNMYEKKGI